MKTRQEFAAEIAAFAAKSEMEKIVIMVAGHGGKVHKKPFEGTWLGRDMCPNATEEADWPAGATWSVALTSALRLLVYVTLPDKRGGDWSLLEDLDDLLMAVPQG